MPRLLPAGMFSGIFAPLVGKKVGLVDGHGNVGDWLIYEATRQLLDLYGIAWSPASHGNVPDVDVMLLFGGGNMGSRYRKSIAIRDKALETGLPCIVLPQSFMGPENKPFTKVFVREQESKKHCAAAELAPDLALGFQYREYRHRRHHERGVFLRDTRSCPTRGVRTVDQYLERATFYSHIVTDRLHFAICGLMMGAKVTLLPSEGYHKNKSMWQTWLSQFDCVYADRLDES